LKTERSWLQKWSLCLLSVTCTQVFTQLLNGIVAFVLIRTLTKQDYQEMLSNAEARTKE
jgi:hypothetical protein